MDKLAMIETLIREVRSVTMAHTKYLSKAREYIPGQMLYLREAHFTVEVGNNPNLTMTELAQKLDVTPGAVTQLAERLHSKGYIERIPDPEDKRRNTVRLTEKGQQLYLAHEEYDKNQYAKVAQLMADYTPEQLEFLIEFENRLASVFREW